MSAGFSAFSIEKKIGIGYTKLIYEFENNFGIIHYRISDLEKLSNELLLRLKKNKNYFKELKIQYAEGLKVTYETFKVIDSSNLKSISTDALFALIQRAITGIELAVGIGHVIEPYAIMTDLPLKSELGKYISDPTKLNEAFILLTTPTEPSFIQLSEHDLIHIANSNDKKKGAEEYKRKYFWIKNNYTSRYILNIDDIIVEAESMKGMEEMDFSHIIEAKKALFQSLNLSEEIKDRLDATVFITLWQDERKKNILIAVDYLERLLEELASRTGIEINLLRHALPNEYNDNIKNLVETFRVRHQSSIYFQLPDEIAVFDGEDYKVLKQKTEKDNGAQIKELSGSAASLGVAIGRVKVCTSIESLNKVSEGDILVASMTRPEYLPAMKKAAAFVTDEGGITCHAAIVAREMKKPCVIGTKNATKVLKDGDLVEVKGHHGLVIVREYAK